MLESTREGGWENPTEPIGAPLARYRQVVPQAWVDYNDHMSESFYLWAMGENSDSFFRYVGINEEYRAAGGSLYTVETHMRNIDEAGLGDQLSATFQILGNDTKRVHIIHHLHPRIPLMRTPKAYWAMRPILEARKCDLSGL
jgi:carnitine 3-dehydrogenase